MFRFRDRMARGRTRTGWLDSRHSFSFGDYRDPEHMGFRALRVINEDRVVPGAGFPTHGHRDMEIISYVLEGRLQHKDNLGNGSVIAPGDVQRMSAGGGILHSEYNPSPDEPVHFLQIWVLPRHIGSSPGYEQKRLALDAHGRFELAAGPTGSGGAVTIDQDALLYVTKLDEGAKLSHSLKPARGAWVQVARGLIALNDTEMREGDGAAIEAEAEIVLEGMTEAEVLLFDLG